MARSVDVMRPFRLDKAPVANVTPGNYIFGDDRGNIGTPEYENLFPAGLIIIENTTGQVLYVRSHMGFRPNDIVRNGSMTGPVTEWDGESGGEWTEGSGVMTHNTGNVVPLSQTIQAEYPTVRGVLVKFTVASRVAGDVRFSWIGAGMNPAGYEGTARTTNATFVEWIPYPDDPRGALAGGLGLGFTPTTDFDGSIDNAEVYLEGPHEQFNAFDFQIASGGRQEILPHWGIRTSNIGVWCPAAATVANISMWGQYVPSKRTA